MKPQKELSIFKLFIHCGILGWCIEILYTSLKMLQRRNFHLNGSTSLWMFPIYGSAAFLRPLHKMLASFSVCLRGTVYAFIIYLAEYTSGKILDKKGLIPWNYDSSRFRINRYIRLDFFPYWFMAGILFEQFTKRNGFAGCHPAKDNTK